MKKLMYSLVLIVGLTLIGCKSEKKGEHSDHEMAKVEYVCPMDCEDGKTYADKNDKCGVCKMKLVKKESEGKHEHDKEGEHKDGKEHLDDDSHDGEGEHEEGSEHDKDGEHQGEEKGHDSDENH
ncbi:MAG: hypothetical protein BM563_06775 [Bacteroidetes bacterium MedPE-SWsnd-G1]|nr:MAG: hypothetical protein BM563_06775 [Bacteroidetes bacterium MedPE-SWsnd-G1]